MVAARARERAVQDERAASALRAERQAAYGQARLGWAPMLDPKLRERTGVVDAGVVWARAQAWRPDPEAEHATQLAEERLRQLRPDVMERYDRLRTEGVEPVNAMRRVAPYFDAPPAALRAALDAAGPLADLVVDDRLSRWTDRLHWVEGQVAAVHDVAPLLAGLPAEQAGRQVARVADQLGVDHATVTGAVVDAVTRDGDAPGRLQRRDRRDDLDRGQTAASPAAAGRPVTAAQLARSAFPSPLHAAAAAHRGANAGPEPLPGSTLPTTATAAAAARQPSPSSGSRP